MPIARPARTHAVSSALGGRTAIVLGATGVLGVAAARALADAGAHVVVVGADDVELDRHFGGDDRFDIRAHAGTGPHPLASDAVVADILVHCTAPADVAAAQWPAVRAGSACVGELRRFIPSMVARRSGSIIAISSPRPCAGRGDGPSPRSRGPLPQVVQSLATEMRPFGVRVNVISASGVDGASAVVFLASDASLHVTGAHLALEPGWSSLEPIDPEQTSVTAASRRGAAAEPGIDTGLHVQPPLLPFPLRPRRPDATESLDERRRA
ncbi:hypothetical protein QL996_05790 [Planococcus sp. APC 4015]|nr:hypothetical protein [Planococcus sp. APC 4015]